MDRNVAGTVAKPSDNDWHTAAQLESRSNVWPAMDDTCTTCPLLRICESEGHARGGGSTPA